MGQTIRKMLAALSPWTSANSQQTAETRQYRAIMSDAPLSKFLAVFNDHDGRPRLWCGPVYWSQCRREFSMPQVKNEVARPERIVIQWVGL